MRVYKARQDLTFGTYYGFPNNVDTKKILIKVLSLTLKFLELAAKFSQVSFIKSNNDFKTFFI